jgi:hypothetical protein
VMALKCLAKRHVLQEKQLECVFAERDLLHTLGGHGQLSIICCAARFDWDFAYVSRMLVTKEDGNTRAGHHPYVVSLYGFCQDASHLYFLLELATGVRASLSPPPVIDAGSVSTGIYYATHVLSRN